MSKGSKPRPFSVSNEEYANRWDAIFGKDVKEDKDVVCGTRTQSDSLVGGEKDHPEQQSPSPT